MTSKVMFINIFMVLILASCAHKEHKFDPKAEFRRDIEVVLNNNIPKFRSCFQSELEATKRRVGVQGRANFIFTVNKKGNVSKSEITSDDIKDGLGFRCMKIILDSLVFPVPAKSDSYDVTQPINFATH